MAEHEEHHNNAGKVGWGSSVLSLLGAITKEGGHHAHVFPGLGPVGGVMGGIAAADEASQEFHEGHYLNGALRSAQSAAEFTAAGAETYAMFAAAPGSTLAGGAAAGTLGAVLGGAALGIGGGMGIEEATRYAGVYRDDHNRPVTGAEIAAGWGNSVAQWIDPAKGNDVNGGSEAGLLQGNFSAQGLRSSVATAAGINTTIIGQAAGLGIDAMGTCAAGWKWALDGDDEKKPADGAPFAHHAD